MSNLIALEIKKYQQQKNKLNYSTRRFIFSLSLSLQFTLFISFLNKIQIIV
jgi:hypothetical protein